MRKTLTRSLIGAIACLGLVASAVPSGAATVPITGNLPGLPPGIPAASPAPGISAAYIKAHPSLMYVEGGLTIHGKENLKLNGKWVIKDGKNVLGPTRTAAPNGGYTAQVLPNNRTCTYSTWSDGSYCYTRKKYLNHTICVLDVQNSSWYNPDLSARSWQYGILIGAFRSHAAGEDCNDYGTRNTLEVWQYSANDAQCSTYDGWVVLKDSPGQYPNNGHWDYYWSGEAHAPRVFINAYHNSPDIGAWCENGPTFSPSEQNTRNQIMTSEMGVVMGLGRYDATRPGEPYYPSVMDLGTFGAYDGYAEAIDRNRTACLYKDLGC